MVASAKVRCLKLSAAPCWSRCNFNVCVLFLSSWLFLRLFFQFSSQLASTRIERQEKMVDETEHNLNMWNPSLIQARFRGAVLPGPFSIFQRRFNTATLMQDTPRIRSSVADVNQPRKKKKGHQPHVLFPAQRALDKKLVRVRLCQKSFFFFFNFSLSFINNLGVKRYFAK